MDAQDSGYVSAEDEDFVLDAATAAKDDALEAQASGALHEPEEPQDSTLTWHQRRKKARRKYEKAAREMANKVEAALQDVAPLWDKLQDGGPTPPLGQDWSSMRSQGHVASTTRGRKRQRSDVDDVLKQRLALSKQPDSRAVQRESNVPEQVPSKWVAVSGRRFSPSKASVLAARAALGEAQADQQVEIQQKVKFAGKETIVTRVVKAGSKAESKLRAEAASQAASEAVHGAGGTSALSVDAVVAQIDGKKAISTLDKSSSDWDVYKVKNKLEDELAHAHDEGFVDKQQFLQRAEAREAEAARRASKTAGRR